jgi:hypothetical protein
VAETLEILGRTRLLFCFPLPDGKKGGLRLIFMFITSQILYLFLQLETLKSTQSSPGTTPRKQQRRRVLQKGTKYAGELICCPFLEK